MADKPLAHLPPLGPPRDTIRFVGRAAELATLSAKLTEAVAGRGGLALLAGEPGIGKTRLAEELAAAGRARGARVLWGRCYEGEGAPAFWPWVQVLRSLLPATGSDALREALGMEAAGVVRLLPELAGTAVEPAPAPGARDAEQARFHLFDSVGRVLARAAATQPLLLLLDDLHWADVPSLLLFEFVARALAESPVLIVGAYRDVTVGRGHPLARTLGEVVRGPRADRLTLGGLDTDAVARIVEEATGAPPPEAVVAGIAAKAEGNPLFVTELSRLMRTGAAADRFSVPLTVREVIGRRLDALPEATTQVLSVAAVIGREFDVEVLAGATTPPREGGGIEDLLESLEAAEGARVIEALGEPGRYRFSHALIREALYEELAAARRVRIHRRVGEVAEAVHAGNLEPHLAELAWHFSQAAPTGTAERAVVYAVRAAERATRLSAHEEAGRQYELAVGLLRDGARRGEILIELGMSLERAGERQRAAATFHDAAGQARDLIAAGVPAAALLGRAALGLSMIAVVVEVDQAHLRLIDEALHALGEVDSPIRAQLLVHLAGALHYAGLSERRDALMEEAQATARRLGEPELLAHVLALCSLMLWRPADLAGRAALAAEIEQLAEAVRQTHLLPDAHRLRITALLDQGDIVGVDAALTAHRRLAETIAMPVHLWRATMWQGMRALIDGQFAEVERQMAAGVALAQRARHPDTAQWLSVQAAVLRREQGRPAEIEPALRGAVERFPTAAIWRAALAAVLAEQGQDTEARLEMERLRANLAGATAAVSDPVLARLPSQAEGLLATIYLADACAEIGDADWAAELFTVLLPYDGHSVVIGPAIAWYGAVSHRLGRLAALLAHQKDAVRHVEAALTLYRRIGARPWIARAEYDLARLLLAGTPDAGGARSLLSEALATAEQLGMSRLVKQARAALDQVSVPASPPVPTTDAGRGPAALPDRLSSREAEVLALLAAGLSAAEVAERLVVAEPTVRRHITNLYTKIGARNRAEATAYAIRHGLGAIGNRQ